MGSLLFGLALIHRLLFLMAKVIQSHETHWNRIQSALYGFDPRLPLIRVNKGQHVLVVLIHFSPHLFNMLESIFIGFGHGFPVFDRALLGFKRGLEDLDWAGQSSNAAFLIRVGLTMRDVQIT